VSLTRIAGFSSYYRSYIICIIRIHKIDRPFERTVAIGETQSEPSDTRVVGQQGQRQVWALFEVPKNTLIWLELIKPEYFLKSS